jgi:hypothetical protein
MKIYLATVLEDGERENKAGTTMTKKRYIYIDLFLISF